jgi:hypothetical protein
MLPWQAATDGVSSLFASLWGRRKSNTSWIILFLLSNEIHDPIKSKSNEIQLLKSNWIWIIANPIPGILVKRDGTNLILLRAQIIRNCV